MHQLGGREFANGKQRLGFAEDAGFVPFNPQPGWVSQNQIEAAALAEDIGKSQFLVHEAPCGSDGFDGGETREVFAQLFDTQLAEFVVQVGLGHSGSKHGLNGAE